LILPKLFFNTIKIYYSSSSRIKQDPYLPPLAPPPPPATRLLERHVKTK
jgi:hypothetical protein